MLLKVIIFITFLHIIAVCGYPQKFMIKNKKTGLVLDGGQQYLSIGAWTNRNSQLWTLQSSPTPGYYIIRNIANQKALDACPRTKALLTWQHHGGKNQRWKLNPSQDSRIQVLYYPNDYLVHKNNKPLLHGNTQNDDSDFWLLVEPQQLAV